MASLSFTILGTGDDQMDPALVVHWKHHRILFNCVEGIKRLSFEHKLHLAGKIKDIFITRVNEWAPAGGTTELLMGIDEALAKEKEPHLVGLHGPSPLIDFIHATQPFFWRPDLAIKIFQYASPDNIPSYDVDELTVQPVTFSMDDPSVNNNGSSGDYPLRRVLAVDFSQYRQQPAHVPQPKFPQLVTSYIVTSPSLPGKFDVVKANALGVPKGPLFGRLVKGEEITLADGRKISPSDCVGPSIPGPVILVLDCITEFVCQSMLESPLFKPYFASSSQQLLSIVYLGLPQEVLLSRVFSELVSAFGPHAVHFFAKEPQREDQHQLYISSETFQAKLHLMAPEFWPLTYQQRRQLKNGPSRRTRADSSNNSSNNKKRAAEGNTSTASSNDKKRSKSNEKKANDNKKKGEKEGGAEVHNEDLELLFTGSKGEPRWWKGKTINIAQPLMSYVLLPFSSTGFDMSKAGLECPPLEEIKKELPAEVVSSIDSDVMVTSSLVDVSSYHSESTIKNDVRISFLGTIAAQVSKYRSVSSIFVELPRAPTESSESRVKYMLLDTGDGCLAQLVRLRGVKEVERILEDMSVLFISHKHGDHMLGVTKLLSKISELKRRRQLRRSSMSMSGDETNCEIEELQSSASNLSLDNSNQHHHHQPHHVCGLCKASFSSPTSVELHSFLHQAPGFVVETNPNPEDPALHFAVSKLSSYPSDDQPLLIIGPMWLQVWLQDFQKIEPRISYIFVDAELLSRPQHVLQPWLVANMGIELQAVRVIHSFPSYAVIIKHLLSNKKFVYSGDTRPCPDLVAAGSGVDLLIHEATHFDDMKEKALSDRHSTLSEAVDVSVQMKAMVTILTHFSGRFETAPPDIDRFQQQNAHLIAAYDFLTVELNDDLEALAQRFVPVVLPRLKLAFPVSEDDQKKHKIVVAATSKK